MGNIDLSNINIANIQTISGMTMSEILQQMKALGIGISGENYSIRDYSDIISGKIITGGSVTMGGYEWLVAQISPIDRLFYMISTDIISKTKYGSNSTYASSTLASTAKTFAESLPSNVQDVLIARPLGGITQKCHAPSLAQINAWFSSNAELQAKYEGASSEWWLIDPGLDNNMTSSQLPDAAMYVDKTGAVHSGGWMNTNYPAAVSTVYGFRAVVALMM